MAMGMDPRAMAAAMKRMGIDVRDIPGVEEVVVRTTEKEYRFRKAQVSVMKAQGQETWTIVGKPDVTPRAGAQTPGTMPPTNIPAATAAPTGMTPTAEDTEAAYVPTQEDIRTVMDSAGCTEKQARDALSKTGGDLAEAILSLQ